MTSEETTHRHTEKERETGLSVMNTRIIELIEYHYHENRLGIFNSYMEFDRLGNYHGYWKVEDAKVVKEYLNDWISRVEKKKIYRFRQWIKNKLGKKPKYPLYSR